MKKFWLSLVLVTFLVANCYGVAGGATVEITNYGSNSMTFQVSNYNGIGVSGFDSSQIKNLNLSDVNIEDITVTDILSYPNLEKVYLNQDIPVDQREGIKAKYFKAIPTENIIYQ